MYYPTGSFANATIDGEVTDLCRNRPFVFRRLSIDAMCHFDWNNCVAELKHTIVASLLMQCVTLTGITVWQN